MELDVTSDTSVETAVRRIEQTYGGLDVAVNNAGIAPLGVEEAFTSEQLTRAFDTNVIGVHRVNRAVLPMMRAAKHGLLVHLGSTMGRVVFPYAGPYTATKFAIEGLIETLHYELADTGVDVAILQPGAFPTELIEKLEGPADMQRIESYGALAERANEFWGPFMDNMANKNPDPGLVAQALLKLVEMSPGTRPLRTVVDILGVGESVENLNQAAQKIQKKLLG
ncbi:MAG: NAD(P)-dependent dehydrogenase (short-subunit alcohol dehydrogenase family) [Gammaproteobacteria bacterium]|jgi:NAD(P)-dependent dehydrogenase (short-subunit alcohol dehydrogenase family)